MAGVVQRPAGVLQVLYKVGEFLAGAVVVLGDGELKGMFEDRLGFCRMTEGDK